MALAALHAVHDARELATFGSVNVQVVHVVPPTAPKALALQVATFTLAPTPASHVTMATLAIPDLTQSVTT